MSGLTRPCYSYGSPLTEDWFLNATGQSAAIPTNCSSSSRTALQQLVCTAAAAAGEAPALINNTSLSVDMSYDCTQCTQQKLRCMNNPSSPIPFRLPSVNNLQHCQPGTRHRHRQRNCASFLPGCRGAGAALRISGFYGNLRRLQPRLIMQCAHIIDLKD